MELRERIRRYTPVLVSIVYMVYFYVFCSLSYENGWLISTKDISFSNVGVSLINDLGNMWVLPFILLLVYRKRLVELGFRKSKVSVVLLLIYILFFILHGDYSIRGFYRAFFYLFIVALPEEIIYRGYVYNDLKKYGRVSAVIISGVVFGIIHAILPSVMAGEGMGFLLREMFNNIGFGIMASFIFVYYLDKGKSIFVPVMVHALLDYSYGAWGIIVAVIIFGFLFVSNRNNEESVSVD